MKSNLTVIAALCCAAFASSSYGETVWSEDFNAPELDQKGATFNIIDMDGVTGWSIDVSNADLSATSDYFRVQSGLMEARDTDGEVVWLTEAVDISAAGNVNVTVNVSENGTHEPEDYFDFYYSIDGGAFVRVENYNGQGDASHTLIDDFTSVAMSVDVGSGSTLVIKLAMLNNAGTEYIRFDDVVVSSGATDPGDGGDDGSLEGVCLNCPDLQKIADASLFDDATYYAPVLAEVANSSPASVVKNVLSTVISQDHKVLTYSEVWTALTESDEDPNNPDNVVLIYKGNSLPKLSNGSGPVQSQNPDNWNREHVWPNSHGFNNDGYEAYTDIHHLRPSDISVNGDRGNLDFDNSDSPLAEAPENRIDGDSFEPRDEVKGQVARMMFYMDARYEGAGSDVTPDLSLVNALTTTGVPELGKLCRLVEWHVSFPVTDLERQRNDTLYEYQGNRNPFIDHPEWVEMLFDTTACGDVTDPGDGPGDGPGEGPGDGPTSTTGGIFISQYIEGSSFNKALEFYNPTPNDIDLAAGNYQFGRFANGGTNGSFELLTGVIPANGTYVIAHPSANAAILAVADATSNNVNHNGDDAYVLTADGVIIDSFGRVGEDPGSAWGTGSFTTANNTLIRNSNVFSGDTNETDEFDPSQEWTGIGNDNSDDLGVHTIDFRELFISEYIEGSSFNKAIEIYNPNGISVDLSAEGYRLALYSNGGTSANFITDLVGTVTGQDVFVMAHPSADPAILAETDQTAGGINHNGDDAYVLFKGDVVVDSFGQRGFDPGSEWGTGDQSTANNTLVRKSTVAAGDTIPDDVFDPAIEWDGFANNTFDNLGSHDAGNGNTGGPGDGEGPELGQCAGPATLISAIQGSGDSSPVVSEDHVIEAVVTGQFPALGGFFVQEESADQDNDSQTSEGLFVAYSGQTMPSVGDVVRVLGTVSESFGKTQIEVAQDGLICGTDTVAPVALTLPFASLDDREPLEGMLVEASTSLVVSDNYNLARFGEVTLSSERLFIPTNQFPANSPEAIALAEKNSRDRVLLDDGMNGSNPADVIYPTGGLSAANTLRIGDEVSSLVGVMDYSFSNYRIIPTVAPTFVQSNPRETSPALASGNVKVASLNVLNLFNGDGMGGGFPTSRGADSVLEFERQIDKTVSAILAMDADIIGLMEIENDGVDVNSTLAQLVARLNNQAGAGTYALIDANGQTGTDEIMVAMLYKTANVTPFGSAKVNLDSVFNRPPLAQTFKASNQGKITVVVNHFKSKGCGGASGADADQNDGQSCYNATRIAQAQALTAWLSSEADLSIEENVLIMGDLNAYGKEDPILAIESAGFTNLIEAFQGAKGYSYLFGGEVGYLDHALASTSLFEQTVDAIEWHINADEPRALDYNVESKTAEQVNDFYAPDMFRMSDHDPVVMSFDLLPGLSSGDLDNDGDVDNFDVVAFMRMLRMPNFNDLAYDFNLDGTVDRLDINAMRSLCTRRGCATRGR